MAQEQGAPYQFTPEGGAPGNSSRDYTGQGYAVYPNGDQYFGEYVDGIRQGKGKYVFANGDKYQGDFKQNKKHGIGKITYKEKGQYNGQWENGVKHGEGIYTYTNKDTYSGWWKFGKKCGKGVYTYAENGNKLKGDWENNQIKHGRWIFPNDTYYEGAFEKGKPNGEGVWYFTNGNTLQGTYNQQVIPNEDPDDPKINLKLDWNSKLGLSESAWKINSHENF